MNTTLFYKKDLRAYIFLTSLVICGLAGSLITAPKIVNFGINFPFSNIVFSILTYPIVDCICELWGKQAARQAMWIGLGSQILIALIIQISIIAPQSTLWPLQSEYQLILSMGLNVVIASVVAFASSQILDIVVYQKLKEMTKGKKLWIRSNLSTYLGQSIDSILFVNIVFFNSNQKLNLLMGSIMIKVILSFLMTPLVYFIVHVVNKYLDSQTLAFKTENGIYAEI
jgi:uncharacterized integral membrane protein (TIGR00697 family)